MAPTGKTKKPRGAHMVAAAVFAALAIIGSSARAETPRIVFDDRLQMISSDDVMIATRDQRRLVVRAFAVLRVIDPERAAAEAGSAADEAAAARLAERLDVMIAAAVRSELAAIDAADARAADAEAAVRVRQRLAREAAPLGVEVVDLRFSAVDMPPSALQATLARMTADRQRVAAEIRAEGEARALARSREAERVAREIVGEAQVIATEILTAAIAERASIAAAAYGQDPEFFDIYRTLPMSGAAPSD